MLDLVDPLRARGRVVGGRWQAWRDEGITGMDKHAIGHGREDSSMPAKELYGILGDGVDQAA